MVKPRIQVATYLLTCTVISTFFIILPGLPSQAQTNGTTEGITIESDKNTYRTPDPIVISGNVSEHLFEEGGVAHLQVYNPQGDLYEEEFLTVTADGRYEHTFTISGELGQVGTYTATISYSIAGAETTFNFNGSSPVHYPCELNFCSYSANINGTSYPIGYKVSGNNILNSMKIDPQSKAIIITLEVREDRSAGGYITLELDKDIIDAKMQDGKTDAEFIVTTGPTEERLTATDYVESVERGPRTITINLPDDATTVRVGGTMIIPEFSTIGALVVAGVMVSSIVVSTVVWSRLWCRQKRI